ncbi:MAG: hypothetical protein KBG48_30400 [Kofleriaceae bacterium]|jgi:hypothetical protein|nr:hypothetical protein [Kofleriaceae bacterium]MBP9171742.1 hypothetical protein [Kofleriaceae bacterium]MBP9856339.1 hypothetical protein [Kofleriaceae bacterium]
MPHATHLVSILALSLTVSACALDDEVEDLELHEPSDEVEPGDLDRDDLALYGWSGWRRVSSTSTSFVELRYCKTSTRVNWEFRGNPYDFVTTGGTAMSSLTTNIAGVSSGSKYRTHNNSRSVFWNFGISRPTPLVVTGHGEELVNIPRC